MIVIPDIIRKVVQNANQLIDGQAVYYLHGHRLEIAKRLLEKDKDSVLKEQKYPLIALREDIPIQVRDGLYHAKLNIAILEYTDKNYTGEERYENVIVPILYPIYKHFMFALRLHKQVMNIQRPLNHTVVVRPFWGISYEEGVRANIFNDPLDAIELHDLEVTFKEKC